MQISPVLLQATVAAAAALAPRGTLETLDKREDWTGDGNVEIYISDTSKRFELKRKCLPTNERIEVNWGSLIPSSIVADGLRGKCGNNGCDTTWSQESYCEQYQTSRIVYPLTHIIVADAAKDWNAQVTFTVADDTYPTWQKNGLISLIESTIAEVAEQVVVNKKKCHNSNPNSLCQGGKSSSP